MVPIGVPIPSAEILLTKTVISPASAEVTPIKIAASPLAMILRIILSAASTNLRRQ
jgi:hypothetical protein